MATSFENPEINFSTTITRGPLPRWQRKALQDGNGGNGVDRFIPDRSSMNLEACKFSLCGNSSKSVDAVSPSREDAQRSLQGALFDDAAPAKILAFKQAPPKPTAGFQAEHAVLFTQSKELAARSANKVLRHIPQTPERILDAPELKQDFYLNLLAWSARNIIAVALGETVYLWDAAEGSITELCTLADEGDYVASVSWVADGSYLAVGTANNQVQLWDIERTAKVRTMTSAGGRVAAMAWNNHILTTGSRTGEIYNHDVRIADHHIQTLKGHTQEVCGLAWSPDGRFLASGGNDNVVCIWTDAGVLHKRLTDHTAAVKALAWCPWQPSLLASGGGTADRKIHFWNAASGAKLNTIDTKSQVSSLQWNKEHREIISGHGFSKNQLSIWSYPTMKKVVDLTGHTERVLSMAISPDGTTVVSAAGDETLRFWKCFASDGSNKKKKKDVDTVFMEISR